VPPLLNTPIAIICFNRPEATARLLRRLAGVKPKCLYVICDGPRDKVPGEDAAVAKVKELFDRLPWPCEVIRNFSDVNLGCGKRVASGLDWVFANVEQAIILEDDCLPTTSFFPYCEELLVRYADDARIGSICGMTHDSLVPPAATSYRFSRYCFVWGWATWRRAWKLYDPVMSPLKDGSIDALLKSTLGGMRARLYWKMLFRRCLNGSINTWDYQWVLTCWKNRLIHVTPSVTLVENIGFGPDSTHTQTATVDVSNILTMNFPMIHPETVVSDSSKDDRIEDRVFSRNLVHRLQWVVRKFLG
jgi:hypothetical protein